MLGFVIAGLVIVGLAVVTSKPFQEGKLTHATEETASETSHEAPESKDEAPSEVADQEPAEARTSLLKSQMRRSPRLQTLRPRRPRHRPMYRAQLVSVAKLTI